MILYIRTLFERGVTAINTGERYNGESKEIIKQAARQMIVDDGVAKFNMRKLSVKSGMSPGTIYYYYGGKADLIFEIVDDLWSGCFNGLKVEGFGSFLEAIQSMYGHILKYLLDFSRNWARELSTLNARDKKSGHGFEKGYMENIKTAISTALKENIRNVSADALEALGEQQITEFVFTNFMYYLRRGITDISQLTYILKKVLL